MANLWLTHRNNYSKTKGVNVADRWRGYCVLTWGDLRDKLWK
jgi:hypothetical protein